MLTPKHKQNIIIGISYAKQFHWYILPITIAILNLNKLKPSVKSYYMSHTTFKKIREFCQTLDNENEKNEYIKSIKPFTVSCEQLSNMLAHASKEKKDFANDFCPSFYINFDKSELLYASNDFSVHAQCVPCNFKVVFQNFLDIIPTKQQFWKLL